MGLRTVDLTPSDVDRQIHDLLLEDYVAPDCLKLLQEVFEVHYQTENQLREKEIYPTISQDEIDRQMVEGSPILHPDKIQFDETALVGLLKKLRGLLAKPTVYGDSSIDRLLAIQSSGEIPLTNLVRKVMEEDGEYIEEVAEKTGESKEDILFLAKALVVPFLRLCAKTFRPNVNLDVVLTNRCPICAGQPLMAKLRQHDGKRMFECSLCNTQWAFNRLKCPFCGNEDQDSLGFFFIEEKSAYRIDVCEKCKRYIKTVDERKKGEDELKALLIEDVATLYLDLMADKKGYRRIVEP